MRALIRASLGSDRRAGRGSRSSSGPPGDENAVYRAAGFTGPRRIEIPDRLVGRDTDEIVASVFSLSFAAPHLFGDRLAEFEAALRGLLHEASPAGIFSEQLREIALDIWR